MRLLNLLLGLVLFSCAVPQTQQTDLKLKIRIIGSSLDGYGPGFYQAAANRYVNEAQFLWDRFGDSSLSSNYISIKEPTGRREGFTSNNGRNLFIDYFTADNMMVKYNGRATKQYSYLWLKNGVFGMARCDVDFPIPAGVDAQKHRLLVTVHIGFKPTSTSTRVVSSVVIDGTEEI